MENVGPDWTVLDIGAAVGVYSLLAARLAPSGRVIAVEPTATVAMLEANINHHGVTNVEVVAEAIGDRTGRRGDVIHRVWGEDPDTGDWPFTTLDDLAARLQLDRCDLVKIDVDGFELEVLSGAEDVLRRFRPRVIIEINEASMTRGNRPEQVIRSAFAIGFGRATILDGENYLFEWREDAEGHEIRVDRRPVLLPEELTVGPFVREVEADWVSHAHGCVARDDARGNLNIQANGPRWAYAASVDVGELATAAESVAVLVEMSALEGKIGIGLYDETMSELVSLERFLVPGERATVVLLTDRVESARTVLLRNADADGSPSRAVIKRVSVHEAVLQESAQPCLGVNVVDVRGLLREERIANVLHDDSVCVRVVGVEDLHRYIGADAPYEPPALTIPYGLCEFTMERDDAPVLAYLYRALAPRRHFEFGTWEGFGATLVAQSCHAEIWTINLPNGEVDASGSPLYASGGIMTDSHESIGWRYRAAGYSERVHQLLGDSRLLEPALIGAGAFDTVLVDGGHAPEAVSSDTENAIRLLRSGGWLLWHGFTPAPEALLRSAAARGVLQAFERDLAQWSEHLEAPMWIRPSNLCVARRR